MEAALAERLARLFEQADGAIHEAIAAVHESPDAPALGEVKGRLAMVSALLFGGVQKHVYREHPAVCPPSLAWVLEPKYGRDDWPFAATRGAAPWPAPAAPDAG
jgi:hypothetical protein